MRLEGLPGAGTWAADEKGSRCTDWGAGDARRGGHRYHRAGATGGMLDV